MYLSPTSFLRLFLSLLLAAAVLLQATDARAGGGHYIFDGGTAAQRAQVRAALNASSFNWNIVPATITIHIQRGVDSRSWRGNIYLDADLLDAGRFAWATVQDEYAHQVDFFVLTPAVRATLEVAFGTNAWCYENPALQGHSEQGCERFTSMIPWAYWQSPDNAYRPSSSRDESATMPRAKFRTLLEQLLGPRIVTR